MLAEIDPGLVALLAAITTPVSVALVAYLNARTAAANELKRQEADEESQKRQEALETKVQATHDVAMAVDAAVNGKAPGEKSLSKQVGELYDAMPADGTAAHPGTMGPTIASQVSDIAEQMPVVKEQVDDLHEALPKDPDNGTAVDLSPDAPEDTGNGEALKVTVAKMAKQQAAMLKLLNKLAAKP